MTANELAGAILNFAFQGKLVSQDPKDEDASILLQKIKAEKDQLMKSGVLKSKGQTLRITEEEIPYEIPENWTWGRISEICELNPRNQIPDDTEVSFIPMQFIEPGFLNRFRQDISQWGRVKKGFTHLKEGDVVFAKITPCFQNRKSAILTGLKNGYGAGTTELHVLRPYSSLIFTQYLLWFVKNGIFIQDGIKNFTGTVGQQRVNTVYISQYLIPIPPFSEQKRIVAKIEELLPLIERYDESEKRLLELNKKFPDELRKAILQQAVQGKLTEQDPHDEPASEILKRIKAEKARLIKEGKIRKEKPLPPISEEEIPFDIPENWEWVRLKEIAKKITDGTHHSPPNMQTGDYMYVTAKNIKDYGVELQNITYVTEETHNEIFSRCNAEFGDVLLIKDGATAGIATVNNIVEPFSMLSSVALIKLCDGVLPKYVVWVIRSNLFYANLRSSMKGAAITRVTLNQIEPMLMPLPPLAEQKRIVARVEALNPLCDSLKNSC